MNNNGRKHDTRINIYFFNCYHCFNVFFKFDNLYILELLYRSIRGGVSQKWL